jgi:anti-anti-sigma factor
MSLERSELEVYETGPLTVVGFGGREILDQVNLSDCRAEILELVEKHGTKVMAFDLTGVKLIPSGMLGLLASLRKLGIEVHVYNPSSDVEEVLEVTRLKELMAIHHIDLKTSRGQDKPASP